MRAAAIRRSVASNVYGLLASVHCVYGVVGSRIELLAIDARQGISRLGWPAHAPDALARAWGRST